MRESVRRFLFGPPRRSLVLATGTMSLGLGLVWLASTPLLASSVRGRVLLDGQPVADAFYYPMPGGYPAGRTGPDGRYDMQIPLLDVPDTVEVCVVLPDGRRTHFGQCRVTLGPFAERTLDVELGEAHQR